jgi:hypothetical protein
VPEKFYTGVLRFGPRGLRDKSADMNEARILSPLEKQHLEQSRYCDFLQVAVEFEKHRQTLLAGYYDQAIKARFEKEKATKHAVAASNNPTS